ncbi:gamma-glutamyl hydrolase [Syngnathoides biaculeatus]|uniref:gamma-glutamyl hydrolase n=1 Tax=Syngnathoides biaculeatus TaxID=300417 RepID=UPI002ADD8CC5|nr:gamma-glutamyl hydrolase [Syngnathoides biaculeatus]
MRPCSFLPVLLVCGCLSSCQGELSQHQRRFGNDRPVIGILTQIVSDEVMKQYGSTYIPASYVKYIESAGSRVMPIRLTLTTTEYENIFSRINGLLLIGGASNLETSDFARVSNIFFQLALKANEAGDHFPVWGTCLGMQLLTVLVSGHNLLTGAEADNVALPLNLTAAAFSSHMFGGFPQELMRALQKEPLTGHFHHYGLAEKAFKQNVELQDFFSLISTNVGKNGVTFVSTIEGKRYPFYGVQWHPEVNRFQWDGTKSFPHSPRAVQLSSLLAQFFVNEGRRSLHIFDDPTKEVLTLIYKYTPVFAESFSGYEQIYFF